MVQEYDTPMLESWGTVKNPAALGGDYVAEGSAGATYRYVFSGTTIQWLTVTGPDQGVAWVQITNEGGHKVSMPVDNYAPTTTLHAPVTFAGLTDTRHTITISVEGESAGSATSVSIDGQSNGTVDLYAAAYAWRTFSFPVPDAVHTLVITALGTKNAASSDTLVSLDQIQIG